MSNDDQSRDAPEHLLLTPEATISQICHRAGAVANQLQTRVLIGLAGGPGCGKSTLAAKIIAQFGARAALVPMDGFHMRHDKLQSLGIADDKGAPQTFEAQTFVSLLSTLKHSDQPVLAPAYSREIEDVVPDALTIDGAADILIIEGNYLLLDATHWRDIRPLLDLAFYIHVPRNRVRARLLKRHAEHGLFSLERNIAHVDNVDLANYDLVARSQNRSDFIIDIDAPA